MLEQDEQTLIKDDNPFSIVILTVLQALRKNNLNDEKLLNLKYSLAKNLLKKKIEKHKIDALLIFLQRYITFADSNYNSKFDRKIEELAENQRTMGISEQVVEIAKNEGLKEGLEKGISKGTARGKVEGIEEGKAEVVKNLLISNRFTVAEIANSPV